MNWASELGRTPLFAGLDGRLLDAVGERAVWRRYHRGAVVFVQGEPGDRCYAILKGAVKISAFSRDGREAVLAVLGPGDVFGELSLFDEGPRSADALVMEPTELVSLDARSLREVARGHPELGMLLVRVLSRRLRQTNGALQDASFFDVTGRLARRLADLADGHGVREDGGVLVDLPLSQESLAHMVGATRESVNKSLAALVRKGLVVRRGRRYLLPEPERLRAEG